MVKKTRGVRHIKKDTMAKDIPAVFREDKSEAPPAPRMEVVEVAEDEKTEQYVELQEMPVKNEEEKLETQVESIERAPGADPELPSQTLSQNEKQKEVVSELFSKDSNIGYPAISVHRASPFKALIVWIVAVFIVVLLIGGGLVVASKGGMKNIIETLRPTPIPTLTPTPSPTPTPSVVRKDLNIEVWNGSGKAGVAGTMKKFLEEKGYTVIGTGNATKFDYTTVEIQLKSDKDAYISVLKSDLESSYAVGSVSSTLKNTAIYDALVIVGKQ